MQATIHQDVFALFSELLGYPENASLFVLDDEELTEIEHPRIREVLSNFSQTMRRLTPDELSKQYVRTFDFGKKTNLYLTYAEHGEERERGPALVQLRMMYSKYGYAMDDQELPDFLPLVLEFLSVAPPSVVTGLLSRFHGTISNTHSLLAEQNNPYALLFEALLVTMDAICSDDVSDVISTNETTATSTKALEAR